MNKFNLDLNELTKSDLVDIITEIVEHSAKLGKVVDILRESNSFYSDFEHIREGFGDQSVILESSECGLEGTLNKAEQAEQAVKEILGEL
jgi:hypothetical protein